MRKMYEEYARLTNTKLNENIGHFIMEGLLINLQKYGACYCPCKLAKTEDTICPCLEFRDTGNCHCKLFLQPNEGS